MFLRVKTQKQSSVCHIFHNYIKVIKALTILKVPLKSTGIFIWQCHLKSIHHEANCTIPKSVTCIFYCPPTLFHLKPFNHDVLNTINIGNLFMLRLHVHNRRLACMPDGSQKNDYLAAFSGDDASSVMSLIGWLARHLILTSCLIS